jgi:microcystin-dependent protein
MSWKFSTIPPKRLLETITSTSTSFKLSDIRGFDGVNLTSADVGDYAYGSFQNPAGTALELFTYDPATIASSSITFLKRGLSFNEDGTETEVSANKLSWVKGVTIVQLGTDAPALFAKLKSYIDDAAIAGGVPATTTVLGITKMSTAPASAASPIAVGDNDTRLPSLVQTQFLSQLYSSFPGCVLDYAGSSVPAGWLECDGSAISRATYSALFTAIGTTWGAGNGTTTFNLPNSFGRVRISAGAGTKVFTFSARSSDTITITGASNSSTNEIQTGQIVNYVSSGSVITGLTTATNYYVIRVAYNQFKLASSLANAQNGIAITLSTDGSGTQTFTVTLTTRTLAETGGEETHAMNTSELLSHTHGFSPDRVIPRDAGGGASANGSINNLDWGAATTIDNTGGNSAMNIMQPFAVYKTIIKY